MSQQYSPRPPQGPYDRRQQYGPPPEAAQPPQWAPMGGAPQHYPGASAPEPPKRRRIWPWVVLAVVLVPILGFVACTAVLGAGISAVDNARKGGTVAIGETFTYASGLGISVSEPKPYDPGNEFIVSPVNDAYEVTVTITNNTQNPVGAALISTNATVAGAPAAQVFDENAWPTQDIAVGQSLAAPFRFLVKEGTTGTLQIAVTDSFNEPVFFTGSL
jgi:hypothetical protein